MNVFSRALNWWCGAPRQINPGAVIPITVGYPEPRNVLAECDQNENGELSIKLSADWSQVAQEMVHEMQHVIEARLILAGDHFGAMVARKAFLDLSHGDFQLGHNDLMTPLPAIKATGA